MTRTPDLRTPAEAERDRYRARVLTAIACDAQPLSDAAALVADAFADVSQLIMCEPFSPHALHCFDVAAEDQGTQTLSRNELRAAFAELSARELMPDWVAAPAEGGTR